MDPTAVAVVGTLTGVALTSITTLGATVLTQRHQQRLAHDQHTQEGRRHRREELRTAFVSYLEAYDIAFATAGILLSARADETSNPETRWRTTAGDEMTRLKQAYLVLCITANSDVREASNACLGSIWALGAAAAAGDVAAYNQLSEDSKIPRDRLREYMRAQLGVA